MGYTLNNVDFIFEDLQDQSFSGNNDIPNSFRISNSLNIKNLKLSVGWQYRTGSPYTPIKNYDEATRIVSFESLNSGRLPNFHRLDASVIYNFDVNPKSTKIQLGLSALNIYARIVPLAVIHRTSQQNGALLLEQVIQRKSLGFTPNLTLRLFF